MSKINMTEKKGFTLIELLLVTSIISLLSTVVMSAIGQARGDALLAVIGQEADNLQKESQIYYTGRGFYSVSTQSLDACPTSVNASWGFLGSSKTVELIESIKDKSGDIGADCAISPGSWAISFDTNTALAAELNLVNTVYAQESETGTICIDSSKRVLIDIENVEVSDGNFRAKTIRVRQDENGNFACSASSN